MNRVRALLDKILYAGLKPGGRQASSPSPNRPGPLRGLFDRFLSGGNPRDPLYLSNRTTAQKILSASTIVVPFVVIGTGLFLWTTGFFKAPPPPAPIAEKKVDMLPQLGDIRVDTVQAVTVTNVVVRHEPVPMIEGVLRNNTTRTLSAIDVVFDLTDKQGSGIGAVTAHVEQLHGDGIATFRLAIKQRNATSALFRNSNYR